MIEDLQRISGAFERIETSEQFNVELSRLSEIMKAAAVKGDTSCVFTIVKSSLPTNYAAMEALVNALDHQLRQDRYQVFWIAKDDSGATMHISWGMPKPQQPSPSESMTTSTVERSSSPHYENSTHHPLYRAMSLPGPRFQPHVSKA